MTAVRMLAVGIILSALLACGEPTGMPGQPRETWGDGYVGAWKLVAGRGPGGEVPLVAGHRITLNLEDASLSGTAACNSYFGEAVIDRDSFTVDDVGQTEMGCETPVMESEAAYIEALTAVGAIERSGNMLILRGDDSELRFERLPPVPIARLVDTRWELESLIYGTGSEGLAREADPAHLILTRKGRVVGSTGCRTLRGKWIEEGDEIQFTRLAADGDCTQNLREQDGHVVGALGDGFTVEIDGPSLFLTGRFGTGLHYRAAP